MSEPAPERPTGQAGQAKKGLQKKIGPLPLWAWGGLAIGGAVVFMVWKKNKQKSSATASPTTSATTAAGTLASQVPQFVNQTYVNPTPPSVNVTQTNEPPPVPPPPHKQPPPPPKPGEEGPGDVDRARRGKGWRGHHNGATRPGTPARAG